MKLLTIDAGLVNSAYCLGDSYQNIETGYLSTKSKPDKRDKHKMIHNFYTPLIEKADFVLIEDFIPRGKNISHCEYTAEFIGNIESIAVECGVKTVRVLASTWKPKWQKFEKQLKTIENQILKSIKYNQHILDAVRMYILFKEGIIKGV